MYSLNGVYKKAIVTGGAGFVGSNLVESLLRDGLTVISIDDYSAGKRFNLKNLKEEFPETLIEEECDITEKNNLEKLFQGVDVVFHQACSKMTICLKNPLRDLEVNAAGTFNLLELAKKYEVKKFVHVSTGSVYGKAQYFPTDESHPLNPTSYYGVSKLAGEKYCRAFSELYDMNISVLRYYHVYGPKQDAGEYGGVIGIFCENALKNKDITIFGDGSQIRSFTHVRDVVNINKLVALKGKTGEAYNCASGLKVSISDIAEKIIGLSGSNSKVCYEDWKTGDIKDFEVSHKKLIELGFEFTYLDFDKGLKETFEWYRENYLYEK
ncbi:NAD-dependent epimerase/dehydratase family protein [Cycloclasticus pugetii]|uniref:NAD-dependent epimerase/dehydratase family protein n=1 Tax=Cycloclasticus pugetii TaxID=34068 RepID=UPI003A8ED1B7